MISTTTHLRGVLVRIAAALLFIALVFGISVSPITAPRVGAQLVGGVVVEGPGPLLAAVVAESAGQAPKDLLTSLVIITAKTALDSLTQSIVNWINTGFEGSPAFVTDLNRNLSNLGDAVANDFLSGLNQVVENNTGFNIRAPFQDQIAAQLREEFYRTTSSYGFDLRNPYQNCYGSSGNFSIGGFLCESQNPANNAYGRYQIARNELFNQLDSAAQNRIAELNWGRGFLSWRGSCGPNTSKASDATGTGDLKTALVSLQPTDKTIGCSVRTPGAVIEQQLANTLGSGVRQLELADNFNEIVSALASQLLNQVLGSSGLSGASQAQSGGGQSFVDSKTNTSLNTSSQLFGRTISDTQAQVVRYREDWQELAADARAANRTCSNDASNAAEASRIANLAASREQEANQTLATLATIEADRARLTASATISSQAIEAVVQRFNNVIRSLGSISSETNDLFSQTRRIAESCR